MFFCTSCTSTGHTILSCQFGFFSMMLLASWKEILFVSEIAVGEQARSCTQSSNGIQKGSKCKSVAHRGQPSSLSNVTDSTVDPQWSLCG